MLIAIVISAAIKLNVYLVRMVIVFIPFFDLWHIRTDRNLGQIYDRGLLWLNNFEENDLTYS